MLEHQIGPSQLRGSIAIPSSKSHTLRAILFASLAEGTSRLTRCLPSPDAEAMCAAMRQLGAQIEEKQGALCIEGTGGALRSADDVIQCGNSGLVLRLVGALAGHIPAYTVLTGDASIRHLRPAKPLIEGLQQLGVFAASSRGDGYAPLLIKGPLTRDRAAIEGRDSQPVSGLLIAAALAEHPISIAVHNPGEKPWVDLTLHWLQKLGVRYRRQGYERYELEGRSRIGAFDYAVPGDFSTAAFPLVAALITRSSLELQNLDFSDIQGDRKAFELLQQMGAPLAIDPERKSVRVLPGAELQGRRLAVGDCIDALPILAVAACFAKGKTEIVDAAIAREKESDRICAIAEELRKMGARIEERTDGLAIEGGSLCGASVESHSDHRIALALCTAALGASGPSSIRGVECIAKTYPDFERAWSAIGAQIR